MTTTASTYNSGWGTTCIQCGDALIAPEWSEYVNERLVLNIWSCTKCGCRFEAEAFMPADARPAIDPMTMEAFFPSLLVA
jgi:ribosomal protein L37AE/L43A